MGLALQGWTERFVLGEESRAGSLGANTSYESWAALRTRLRGNNGRQPPKSARPSGSVAPLPLVALSTFPSLAVGPRPPWQLKNK